MAEEMWLTTGCSRFGSVRRRSKRSGPRSSEGVRNMMRSSVSVERWRLEEDRDASTVRSWYRNGLLDL